MKARLFVCVLGALLVPAIASAQASVTGTVRDASGAVVPGVTVEAASPALIEKVRVVTTDGTGQYRVVDLRPGTYTVTFTLPGFATVRREGVELTGNFTATVNAEIGVAALEQAITVTGQAPIVDVQSTTQQRVITAALMDTLPSGRRFSDVGVLIPGVYSSAPDVGGVTGAGSMATLSVHGSIGQDQRVMVGGLAITNLDSAGGFAVYTPNPGSSQEITFDTSGTSAENPLGGVTINVVPKEGGNSFNGTLFATGVTSGFQGSNFDSDLQNRGFTTPNRIKVLYDINPGGGGRIVRDKLWFYASGRWQESTNFVGGMFYNANLGKTSLPDAWLYKADLNQPAWSRSYTRSVNGRVAWQATTRDKFSFFYDDQTKCFQCPGAAVTQAPETTASGGTSWPVERFGSVSWTSVRSARLLLDVALGHRDEHWEANEIAGADRSTLPVTDQATGITYHGLRSFGNAIFDNFDSRNWTLRASASYVTGSHSFKAGITNLWGRRDERLDDNTTSLVYRFNNGIPNQIAQRATPYEVIGDLDHDLGLFAQDRWTVGRLTVNAGIRFDWFKSSYPAQHLGPGVWVPTRNVDLPAGTLVDWTDLSPRLGGAYNLVGDGRTAIKVSMNRYVNPQVLQGGFGDQANPVNRFANLVSRSWTDANGNYVPDCNLLRTDNNGECGPMLNSLFGQPVPSTAYDPESLQGFGHRAYNWELSTSIEQQLAGNVSASVGYFHRWFGNAVILDNRATTAADYTRFSIPLPVNPLLPNSGTQLQGFYDLNPAKVGQVNNYVTFDKNYGGGSTDAWHGADVNLSIRNWHGLLLQGGASTGRRIVDQCAMIAQVPEMLDNTFTIIPLGFALPAKTSDTWCNTPRAWLTQAKILGSYRIPRIDVQASATLQSLAGPEVSGVYVATNAVVSPSLGRLLSANAPATALQLVPPGVVFGERLNQLDLRFTRRVAIGRTRAAINVDVYNATNSNAVTGENASFAVFRQPNAVVPARFAKLSVQFDF